MRSRGLTLIEVLCSMALLGTLGVSAVLATSRLAGAGARSAQVQRAAAAADALLLRWTEARGFAGIPRNRSGFIGGHSDAPDAVGFSDASPTERALRWRTEVRPADTRRFDSTPGRFAAPVLLTPRDWFGPAPMQVLRLRIDPADTALTAETPPLFLVELLVPTPQPRDPAAPQQGGAP